MKNFAVIIGTLFFMLSLAVIENQAVTRTVTTLSDGVGVVGSLRERIAIANAGDTIVFQASLRGPISLINQIVINKNLIINGPGADVVRVSGLNNVRVFNISAGNVTISGLRITQGFASGAGGGAVVDGGNLTLNNCHINNNDAESGGGLLVFGGSTLTVTNSTINGNSSAVEGGGISVRGGTLVITNSTISGNQAPDGGGISVDNGGTTTILNSTISGNGVSNPQTGDVGGLRVASGLTVNLKNTIVADNIGSPSAPTDIGGTVNSQGNNLIENLTGATVSGTTTGNITGIDPQLTALASNGGTTPTQALMATSPAIDAGNNTGAPTTDQRGAVRSNVDIGAFEAGVPVTSGTTSTGSNVNTSLGAVSITFAGVSTAGTTTQIPIDPSSAGTLPGGYSFGAGFPAFEITTTAVYTAPMTVCLQVPSVSDEMIFNALTFFHYEGGVLVDRTSSRDFPTRTICASVNSLSPFAVAQNLAPSAANVSISGRVSDSNGNSISRVRVSITGQNGETRSVRTNTFGFYRFVEVPAGETYIISAFHKRWQFNSRVITVSDEIQDADFTAEPE